MSLKRKSQISYTPKAKWNALTGDYALVDRVRNASDQWEDDPRVVPTENFEAIIDVPGAHVGWVDWATFDLRMVPIGQDWGDAPGDGYKECVRLALQMTGQYAETGPRILTSAAIGFWDSMSDLRDDYLEGVAKHPDQLPVARIASSSARCPASKRPTRLSTKLSGGCRDRRHCRPRACPTCSARRPRRALAAPRRSRGRSGRWHGRRRALLI